MADELGMFEYPYAFGEVVVRVPVQAVGGWRHPPEFIPEDIVSEPQGRVDLFGGGDGLYQVLFLLKYKIHVSTSFCPLFSR